MPFCRQCGEPVPDEAAFCSTCGASQALADQAPGSTVPVVTNQEQPASADQGQPAAPASPPFVRLALIGVGCLLAVLGSFMAWEAVLFISVTGTRGDGVVTLLLGVAGLGPLAAKPAWRRRWLYALEAALAAAAATVA